MAQACWHAPSLSFPVARDDARFTSGRSALAIPFEPADNRIFLNVGVACMQLDLLSSGGAVYALAMEGDKPWPMRSR